MVIWPTRHPRFNPRNPRVSSIGGCIRHNVAIMQGQVPPRDVDPYYTNMGYAMQYKLAIDLQEAGNEVVVQEIEVPTCIDGVFCHPDIWVQHNGVLTGIQVKTLETDEAVDKLEAPYPAAVDQARLEWVFAHESKKAFRSVLRLYENHVFHEAPSAYTVCYISRTGTAYNWFPVEWSGKENRRLKNLFTQQVEMRDSGNLPERPYSRPGMQCSWDGPRGTWVCPMYEVCW